MAEEFADLRSDTLHFTPVRYCRYCRAWVRVAPEDMAVSATDHGIPATPQTVRPLLRRLVPARVKSSVRSLHHRLTRADRCQQARIDFEPGSVFLDLDSAWHSLPERCHLLPELHRRQVATMAYIHDLVPVTHPDLCHPQTVSRFRAFIHAHLANGSAFACNSEDSRQSLVAYAQHGGYEIDDPCVARLGIRSVAEVERAASEEIAWIGDRRVVLCVGTLEPRKNQGLLLEVMTDLFGEYGDVVLVLVGRSGWRSEEIIRQMQRSGLLGSRIIRLDRCSDRTLMALYRTAYLHVTPSLHEGFGLPLAEALSAGCVSLSSNRGALPETGGVFADYFDPTSQSELEVLLRRYLGDPSAHQARRASLESYRPPTWLETASDLAGCIERVPEHVR